MGRSQNPFNRPSPERQSLALRKLRARLEAVVGRSVTEVEPRDTVNRNEREVEEVWVIDGRRLAVEHKSLDVYLEQRAIEARIDAVLDRVVGRLQGRFPCQVKVHLGGEAELKRADAAALSERIAEVVEAAFPSLHNQVWTTVVVPNCPFEVGVIKTEEFPGGTVYKSTGTPSDEATARRDSIIATLGKAVTKFDRYPRPQFDRVLLLDVADPQNDSPWSTGAAYRAAADERPHLVTVFDFVFRVDTKYDFGDRVPPGDVQCLQHRELLWPETGTRWDDGRRSLTPAPDPRWRWGEAPRA